MRGAPTVVWTCDRCHATETKLADQYAPAGWKRVTSADLDETARERYRADWCGLCVKDSLRPLTRVKGQSDD